MESKKSKDTIKSLEIGINIIETIEKAGNPLSMTEIQEKTNITKSNLYKYMNTLLNTGLVQKSGSGHYQLGSRLVQYGMSALGKQDYVEVITPYLKKISEACRNTALFSVVTNRGSVVAKIWNSTDSLNIGARIGTVLPPNSSTGKVYNTFSVKNGEIDSGEEREIIENNIAFASEPIVESVSSVSIPVFTYGKELIGIITVVGFHHEIPQDTSDEISQYLLNIHKELSEQFGYVK